MKADTASHDTSTTVQERIRAEAGAAILFDPGASPQVDEDWFDPDHWRRHGMMEAVRGGRGGALLVDTPAGECVLRHYHRGGAVAAMLGDRYFWNGADRTRCFREFRLLQAIVRLGLPGPLPIAARYRQQGFFYSADLITRRIERAHTLAEHVVSAPLTAEVAREVGALVARFHREGIWHADLNAHNVMVSPAGMHLIDFDRGRFRRDSSSWRQGNLQRLHRSLVKLGAADIDTPAFEAQVWKSLLAAYERTLAA